MTRVEGEAIGAIRRVAASLARAATGTLLLTAALTAFGFDGQVAPREGLWWRVDESGSGLSIEREEATLVVTFYTYRESGEPIWYLAVGDLVDGTFEAPLKEYAGGSCFECRPFQENMVVDDTSMVRIEFEGVSYANMWIDDSERIPIRSFQFGIPYRQIGVEDEQDHLRPVLIPEMTGEWVFHGTTGQGDIRVGEGFRDIYFSKSIVFFPLAVLDPAVLGSDIFVRAAATIDEQFSFQCVGRGTPRFKTPICGLVERDPDRGPSTEDPFGGRVIVSIRPQDMHSDYVVGYLGEPLPPDSPEDRGERLVFGYRVLDATQVDFDASGEND